MYSSSILEDPYGLLNESEFEKIGYFIKKKIEIEPGLFFCWGTSRHVLADREYKFACFLDQDGNVHSPMENAPALIHPGLLEFYHHGTLILEKELDLCNDDGDDCDEDECPYCRDEAKMNHLPKK